jgi:hypothetical protein
MTDLRNPPFDPKYVQSMSAQALVRDLLKITEDTVESAKIAILRKPPLDWKYAQSMSAQALVRDLLKITEDTVESAKIAIENSQHCLCQQELNLDTWPTRNRIRESF